MLLVLTWNGSYVCFAFVYHHAINEKKKITSEPVVEDASDQTTESISENASNSQKHTIHVIDDSSNPSNHHVEAAAKYFSPPSSPHRGTYQYDVEEGLGEDFLKATYYFDDYNTQGCSIM